MRYDPRLKIACLDAINEFGKHNQIDKCIEECAELIDALLKYRNRRASKDAVRSEIADVHIMISQMAIIFGEDDVDLMTDMKVKRLEERIEEHHIKGYYTLTYQDKKQCSSEETNTETRK